MSNLLIAVFFLAAFQTPTALDTEEMTPIERQSASVQIFNAAVDTFDDLDRDRQEDAYILVSEAIRLFPEQESIETFDPDLAWMMLYRSFVSSELELTGDEDFAGRTVRGITYGGGRSVFAPEARSRCVNLEWERQVPIRNFGRAAWKDGGFASVLVGMHIDAEGEPTEVVILDMMPEDSDHLRVVTERALRRWRADPATIQSEGCTNELQIIHLNANARYRLERW